MDQRRKECLAQRHFVRYRGNFGPTEKLHCPSVTLARPLHIRWKQSLVQRHFCPVAQRWQDYAVAQRWQDYAVIQRWQDYAVAQRWPHCFTSRGRASESDINSFLGHFGFTWSFYRPSKNVQLERSSELN